MQRYIGAVVLSLMFLCAVSCGSNEMPPAGAEIVTTVNGGGFTAEADSEELKGGEMPKPDTEAENTAESGALPQETETVGEPETETPEIEEIPPPEFGFFDAHADTITRALLRDQELYRNNLHVDFERLYEFGAPVQVFVLWCADKYVADAFNYTNMLIDFFESELAKYDDIIEIALTLEDMERNARNNKISAVLSIEGGEALMGDIENLEHFYNRGVRIFALTWNRENELGFGQATNSQNGLKPFGIEVLKRMEELGVILDVSHLNEAGFWDAHRSSVRPYMASHSNAYSVRAHPRNLTDEQITAIAGRGGIIGLALYPLFLSSNGGADINDIFAHIEHFIDLDAGDNLGLGGDLDGFNGMPEGFTSVSSYKMMSEEISKEFGEAVSKKIMSGNFYDFFARYFG